MLAKAFGLGGQGAMLMSLGGGFVGLGAMMVLFPKLFGSLAPLGPLGIAIGIIIIAFTAILGIGKTKKVVVEFKCYPWEAPTGAVNCEKCNQDPLKPCTEYRCASLGQACKLENEDTENPICIADKNDGTSPVISTGEISEAYKFVEKAKDVVDIIQENGECIPEFTGISFSLKTDEYAQCKWSYERTEDYETLEEYFAEGNSYTKNHTNAFMMPSIESLEAEFNISIGGDIREQLANPSMYVRCQDSFGNYNKKEFTINFCVKSGPDLTPAELVATLPINKAILKFGVTETPMTIWMSEPTTCRYDSTDKNDYDSMGNEMTCDNSVMDFEDYGWPCKTTLTGLDKEENNIYIKCKDQPWLIGTENEPKRNANTNSFVYTLYSSKTGLKIDSIKVTNTTSGFEPVSVTLEAETSGGVNNGESLCSYSFTSSEENLIEFKDSLSNKHKQIFTSMMGGEYIIYVKCEDNAGNSDTGNVSFKIDIDSSPPIVVRAYKLGGRLEIITNEEGRCYYNFERCNFNIENATTMTTGLSKIHSAEWKIGKTYYIKCEDVFGNENPTCAIKIIPNMFS